MTDLEKWLEDIIKKLDKVGACKKKRLTPEEIRIRAELLRIDFPKALRMLEVAVEQFEIMERAHQKTLTSWGRAHAILALW